MSDIKIKNHEVLSETKAFLETYLNKKTKGIDQNVYLSLYFSSGKSGDREARFRRALREAELSLKAQLNTKTAENMILQLQKIDSRHIVREANLSVAIFCTETFSGMLLIPFPVTESVVVARSLHLKPILNWINQEDQFYLVTMSSKLCRLLKGDAFSMKEVARVSFESPDGKKSADKVERQRLIQLAEEKFYHIVKEDNHPIILGGVNPLHDVFKKVNRDPDVMQSRLIGNLDRLSYRDLHARCLMLLSEKRTCEAHSAVEKYRELSPYGKVLDDLNQITIAAVQGRIKNLVIAEDKFIWGKLDKDTGKISSVMMKNLAVPEDDILDDLAEIVIARGGGVTMCKQREMPSGVDAFAFLK